MSFKIEQSKLIIEGSGIRTESNLEESEIIRLQESISKSINEIPDELMMSYNELEKYIKEMAFKDDIEITRRQITYYIDEEILPIAIKKGKSIKYNKSHLLMYLLVDFLKDTYKIKEIKQIINSISELNKVNATLQEIKYVVETILSLQIGSVNVIENMLSDCELAKEELGVSQDTFKIMLCMSMCSASKRILEKHLENK